MRTRIFANTQSANIASMNSRIFLTLCIMFLCAAIVVLQPPASSAQETTAPPDLSGDQEKLDKLADQSGETSTPAVAQGGVRDNKVYVTREAKFIEEFYLTLAAIGLGIVVTLLVMVCAKFSSDAKFDDVAKVIVAILVVSASLILITAGYDSKQVAPAFGLFGTIIGYILGKSSK